MTLMSPMITAVRAALGLSRLNSHPTNRKENS